ncbi:GNAT family N-acetyltransferase [Pannonibacter sp.]|uniref:GNAT family N-acetyltransferase n=1 Tax=Pannonibacter sp. TaxID=1906786 RepID=UPI003F6EA38B
MIAPTKKSERQEVLVRAVAPEDAEAWRRLYRGYAAFYDVPMDDSILDQTWAWLIDSAHIQECIVAVTDGGEVIGFAHFRAFPKPLLGKDAGFLDDLFVDPDSRGLGIGRHLIERLSLIARERSWPLVRWITAPDNAIARGFYDEVAQATPWITYDLKA